MKYCCILCLPVNTYDSSATGAESAEQRVLNQSFYRAIYSGQSEGGSAPLLKFEPICK